MSENQDLDKTEKMPAKDVEFEQVPVQKPAKKPVAPATEMPSKPVSSGRGIALFALLLACIAICWGAWQEFRSLESSDSLLMEADNQNKRLQAEISELKVAIEAMGGSIVGEDVLQPKFDDFTAQINTLSGNQLQQVDVDTALQSRLTTLEQGFGGLNDRQQLSETTLSSLALNKQATDRDVALAEVAFLVRAAAQRLEVYDDSAAAVNLLRLADQQLATQDAQLFASVRQRIQQEILSINTVAAPDVVAITGQLLALEQSVDLWQSQLPERDDELIVESTDGESGPMSKLSYLMKSLFTIREDQGAGKFLTLTQAEQMKDRIRLELQSARVAALAGRTKIYQASVQRVTTWLSDFFDPTVTANAAALESLKTLAEINLDPEWPDLNSLLVLTRQLQSRPAQNFDVGATESSAEPAVEPEA